LPHQPNLYLEPKWLRCSLVLSCRPTEFKLKGRQAMEDIEDISTSNLHLHLHLPNLKISSFSITVLLVPELEYSATGTRTWVARVRAEYPNQLDYSGSDTFLNLQPNAQGCSLSGRIDTTSLRPYRTLTHSRLEAESGSATGLVSHQHKETKLETASPMLWKCLGTAWNEQEMLVRGLEMFGSLRNNCQARK
jgi:hypothetical protein